MPDIDNRLNNTNNNSEAAFKTEDDLYNKQIKSVPAPKREIGIDIDHLYDNIISKGESNQLDISKIESFTQASQNRDTIYELLDTMSEDSTISAVLETYAEDATETNDSGRIVWCESDDSNVNKFVTFLLDTMNVDKHIYKWVASLIKYGDLYLRLYKESEYNDSLFDDDKQYKSKKKLDEALAFKQAFDKYKKALSESVGRDLNEAEIQTLREDVKLKLFSKNDKFVHYLEMVPNPAEIFELTKFGKTYAYIKADVPISSQKNKDNLINSLYKYNFKKSDVTIYPANNFVHASLEDNTSRSPEQVCIFQTDDENEQSALTYNVKRGQSLLYDSFKVWREMMLLENSLLLNRLTKSSIIRVIGVEVGDMPKENVGPHLMGIKQLVEQKSALNTGESLSEYTNPGPMENNIYVPTHGGIGAITTQQIGGDVDVKGLSDIDYFKNKMFGALRVPKQFFGFTDDNAGFSGGESLSLISSRYAKAVKRIQNTMIQTLTDAINILLIDKGLDSYINQFELHMLPPTTSEEVDRRENMASKVQIASDVMNLLSDMPNESAKLRILKILLSGIVDDAEVMDIIQEQIEAAEEFSDGDAFDDNAEDEPMSDLDPMIHSGSHVSEPNYNVNSNEVDTRDSVDNVTQGEEQQGERILPTPDDLGIDMTDNNIEF